MGVGSNLQQQITGPEEEDEEEEEEKEEEEEEENDDDDDDHDGVDNDDKDDDIIVVMSVMCLKGMELIPTKAEHITPPQFKMDSSIPLKFSAFHLCLRLMLPHKQEAWQNLQENIQSHKMMGSPNKCPISLRKL